MNNTPQNAQTQTQPLQTQIDELRLKNEMMDLAIDLAFKERMFVLLKNIDSDPELLLGYLKMHDKRQAQKLKEFVAKLKARDLELDEKLAERRLILEERKQILNEKKFQHENQDLPHEEEAASEPAPKPAPATAGAPPQQSEKASIPVKSPAPTPRAETTATR